MAQPRVGADVVEVLPDVTGLDRTFHYLLPDGLPEPADVGTIVRVVLHGRRVRGWVVAMGTTPPEGVEVRPIAEVVSKGPPPEVVDLCRFAAWRWAGRLRQPLLAASPERVVRNLPPPLSTARLVTGRGDGIEAAVTDALERKDAILRLPPLAQRLPVVLSCLGWAQAASPGRPILVLVESHYDCQRLARQLAAKGVTGVLVMPDAWAAAAGGGGSVVVGTRNAVLAPADPAAIVVLDAHSEAYRNERAPNFDARVLAAERARRSAVPVLFVSPAPNLELVRGRAICKLEPSSERRGWGSVGVLDRRKEDPAQGGYSSALAEVVRKAVASARGRPVVAVLNRAGRARLLGCDSCREVQRCERCGAAVAQLSAAAKGRIAELTCPRCGSTRTALCSQCGSGRLRVMRQGVSKAREHLEALVGLPVGEVAGARPSEAVLRTPVLIGTEAVLHRVGSAAMVVFLDFDQELFAPRFRAPEQALVLLARAVRLAGGSGAEPLVVVRTSHPENEVVQAAQRGDPSLVADAEHLRRVLLRLPPEVSMAVLTAGGPDAGERIAALAERLSVVPVSPKGEAERWLVSAPDPEALAEGLSGIVATEPSGWAEIGLHVEVDPISF